MKSKPLREKNVKKKLLLKKEEAFTLIEMTVAMSIIALMVGIGAYAMMPARKQAFLDAASKKVISTTREAMNNSISVLPDAGTSSPAVAWVVRFDKEDTTSFFLEDYYRSGATVVRGSKIKEIALDGGTEFEFSFPNRYLEMVYTSPFGNFYAVNTANADGVLTVWSENPRTKEKYPGAEVISTSTSTNLINLKNDYLKSELDIDYKNGTLNNKVMSTEYYLKTSSAGDGSGTLSQDLGGDYFSPGTVVKITAIVNTGSSFSGWSGCDSVATNICTVTMNGQKEVTASFSLNSYSINVSSSGNGTGKGSGTRPYGATAMINGTPASGYCFKNWTGSITGLIAPLSFTVDGNENVVANFDQAPAIPNSPSSDNSSTTNSTFAVKASLYKAGSVVSQHRKYNSSTGTWTTWETGSMVSFSSSPVTTQNILFGTNITKAEIQFKGQYLGYLGATCTGPWSPIWTLNKI